jgi:hypothetical protein
LRESGFAVITRAEAALAQLVEHLIRNEGVGGSNPSGGTIQPLAEDQGRPQTTGQVIGNRENSKFGRITKIAADRFQPPLLTVFLTVQIHSSFSCTVMLSDLAIRNAKPQDRSYKLADGEGLYLFVHWRGGSFTQLRSLAPVARPSPESCHSGDRAPA